VIYVGRQKAQQADTQGRLHFRKPVASGYGVAADYN
jgi:hypothetical protein